MCVVTIDQPITDESFSKRVFDVHIGVGKKQTRQRCRSTDLDVLPVYPEFPALITSVDGERDGKMRQMVEQRIETDIRVGVDAFDSTFPRYSCQPPGSTDTDFPQ
jgi:hypothetical protein